MLIQLFTAAHSQERAAEIFLTKTLGYDGLCTDEVCVYFIVDKASCKKCEYRASELMSRIAEGYGSTRIFSVFLVNRLADTTIAKACQAYLEEQVYVEKYRVDSKTLREVTNTWIIANKGIIETGSLIVEEELELALPAMDRLAGGPRIARSSITTPVLLDESAKKIYTPTVSSSTTRGMIAIGDQNQPYLCLYDIQNGRVVHSLTIADSVFETQLREHETLYLEENELPCIRTVEFLDEENIFVLAAMVFSKLNKQENRLRKSTREIALLWQPRQDNRIRMIKDSSLEQLLHNYSARESYVRDSVLTIVYHNWTIPDTAYDRICTATTYDLGTGVERSSARIDSVYERLGLGVNLLRGYTAETPARSISTQSLSMWLIDERSGDRFAKHDTLFRRQHDESFRFGLELRSAYTKPYVRAKNYAPLVTTRALFTVGDNYLLSATADHLHDNYFLELYAAEDMRYLNKISCEAGYFVEHDDSSFYHVYRDRDVYKLERYEILSR